MRRGREVSRMPVHDPLREVNLGPRRNRRSARQPVIALCDAHEQPRRGKSRIDSARTMRVYGSVRRSATRSLVKLSRQSPLLPASTRVRERASRYHAGKRFRQCLYEARARVLASSWICSLLMPLPSSYRALTSMVSRSPEARAASRRLAISISGIRGSHARLRVVPAEATRDQLRIGSTLSSRYSW
jgi:hypothetical protein